MSSSPEVSSEAVGCGGAFVSHRSVKRVEPHQRTEVRIQPSIIQLPIIPFRLASIVFARRGCQRWLPRSLNRLRQTSSIHSQPPPTSSFPTKKTPPSPPPSKPNSRTFSAHSTVSASLKPAVHLSTLSPSSCISA